MIWKAKVGACKQKCWLLIFGAMVASSTLHATNADSTRLRRQLQLTVDNDAYFFTSYDRYYSSGIFASYSRLIEKPYLNLSPQSGKYSVDYWFSHYIFTPKNILWDQVEVLDRPYAGMATLGIQLNYLYENAAFSLRTDVGWMGPATQTGELMRWWHKTLRIRQPRGWDYQINNTPVVVLSPQYYRRLPVSKNADVVSVSSFDMGTVFNRLSQEVAVRVGRPGKLNQSHFTNSLFGASKGHNKLVEWYLLASLEGGFVVYDATIDGNFIGPESPYVEQSESWVLRHTYGLVLAGKRVDFELAYKITSREVVGAEEHRYMRCKIGYRI